MKLTIYTDGSSRGNPGPGGWAAIIITDTEVIELGGAEQHTTNNRMELLGAIKGLREVGPHMHVEALEVFTDSEYVKNGRESCCLIQSKSEILEEIGKSSLFCTLNYNPIFV
jgi:ribonuclease HI